MPCPIRTPDPYLDGLKRRARTLQPTTFGSPARSESLLISAKSIKHDDVAAAYIAARLQTLRHLLKQVGHNV